MATYTVMPFLCDGCYQAIIVSDVGGHGEAWCEDLGYFVKFAYSFTVQMRNANFDEFLHAIVLWSRFSLPKREQADFKITVRHPTEVVKQYLGPLLRNAQYSGEVTNVSDVYL